MKNILRCQHGREHHEADARDAQGREPPSGQRMRIDRRVGWDRLPVPYLPEGLAYDPQEGPGEVLTPLLGTTADDLLIGDRVWFRHAKAGELCERFATLHLVEDDQVVDSVPTYRGEGHTFL